jgi:hypothetical protein
MFCANWSDSFDEVEEVISVNGEKCICRDCEIEQPCLKPLIDTPSFHNSNWGNCLKCTTKAITKADGKIFNIDDKEIGMSMADFLSK